MVATATYSVTLFVRADAQAIESHFLFFFNCNGNFTTNPPYSTPSTEAGSRLRSGGVDDEAKAGGGQRREEQAVPAAGCQADASGWRGEGDGRGGSVVHGTIKSALIFCSKSST